MNPYGFILPQTSSDIQRFFSEKFISFSELLPDISSNSEKIPKQESPPAPGSRRFPAIPVIVCFLGTEFFFAIDEDFGCAEIVVQQHHVCVESGSNFAETFQAEGLGLVPRGRFDQFA